MLVVSSSSFDKHLKSIAVYEMDAEEGDEEEEEREKNPASHSSACNSCITSSTTIVWASVCVCSHKTRIPEN